MFQRLKKLFFTPALALLVMVTMSVGLAASAQAAQPTYQPTFSPNQHVYLDPLLENGNPSVNLNGLEQKLIDEGKVDEFTLKHTTGAGADADSKAE